MIRRAEEGRDPSSRAAALRSTALATSLALAVGYIGLGGGRLGQAKSSTAEAAADRAQRRAQDNREDHARDEHAAKNTAPAEPCARSRRAARAGARDAPACGFAAAGRKPPYPAAVAATSSTSQADTDALENVIELVRKHKPADATQAEATISDPVARKLAEWIILRSDDNGASVERYRAFIVGQSELAVADLPAPAHRGGAVGRPSRRRHGVGMVRKRIAGVGQGQVLAGAGDARARRPRQCRASGARRLAQRSHVRGHRKHGARSVRRVADAGRSQGADGLLLYGSEHEAALRAAKRLGAARSRWRRRGSPPIARPPTPGRCSMRFRANCTATPATSSARSSCSAARRNSPRPPS